MDDELRMKCLETLLRDGGKLEIGERDAKLPQEAPAWVKVEAGGDGTALICTDKNEYGQASTPEELLELIRFALNGAFGVTDDLETLLSHLCPDYVMDGEE